ncbi:MAG: helix-turn-helix domain-containing protein [Acidobacteriia bacterium]|nr:helix-turn-helix domain-containing protein [Terriglobia bacterium]
MKLDRVKLERRRLQAARLLQQGVPEAEVARRVGVHRQSVNRWARQLAQGGRQALKRAPRAGRPPQLSAADRRLTLEWLPGYAPELNPVEHIWGYLKEHELPNLCPRQRWELSAAARAAWRRMRRRPTWVMAFWKKVELF